MIQKKDGFLNASIFIFLENEQTHSITAEPYPTRWGQLNKLHDAEQPHNIVENAIPSSAGLKFFLQ